MVPALPHREGGVNDATVPRAPHWQGVLTGRPSQDFFFIYVHHFARGVRCAQPTDKMQAVGYAHCPYVADFRYKLIFNGECGKGAYSGYEYIDDRGECEEAAEALGLEDTSVGGWPDQERPRGCIYAENDWLSMGNRDHTVQCGISDGGLAYNCICREFVAHFPRRFPSPLSAVSCRELTQWVRH